MGFIKLDSLDARLCDSDPSLSTPIFNVLANDGIHTFRDLVTTWERSPFIGPKRRNQIRGLLEMVDPPLWLGMTKGQVATWEAKNNNVHQPAPAAAPNILVWAFLMLDIPTPDQWDVEERYREAVGACIHSTSSLLLPWPAGAIPEVNDKNTIYVGSESGGYVLCLKAKQYYALNVRELVVSIHVAPPINGKSMEWFLGGRHFNLWDLLDLAKEGWMIDQDTSITQVLERAGLPTTRAAFTAAE